MILGETLIKCINIFLEAEKKLNEANGDITTAISDKLNRVLSKINGWKQLRDINNILYIVYSVSSNMNNHRFDLNGATCNDSLSI